MTITLRTAGTATALTATATTLNPAVPAGAVAGDLSVLCLEYKPYSTVITVPGGWTKIWEITNGTVANATDVGSVIVGLYVLESAAVGAIGAITATGADTGCAVIHTYSRSAGISWDYTGWTFGADSANDANYSSGADPDHWLGVTTGDVVITSTGVNTDLGTISAQTVGGMAGATLSNTVLTSGASGNGMVTTGNDSRLVVVATDITAGSSVATPTFDYTNASFSSGTTLWLRLREVAPPYQFGVTTPTPRFRAAK